MINTGEQQDACTHRQQAAHPDHGFRVTAKGSVSREYPPEISQGETKDNHGYPGHRLGAIGLPINGLSIQQVTPVIIGPTKPLGIAVEGRAAWIVKGC